MNETWTDEIIGRNLYGVGLFGTGYYGQTDWDSLPVTSLTWTVQNPSAASWTGQTVTSSTWTNQSPVSYTHLRAHET